MAKKQQRYRAADLALVMPGLIGQQISLILDGRQVYQVKIKALDKNELVAIDALHRVHRFPLALIDEVIVEKHA